VRFSPPLVTMPPGSKFGAVDLRWPRESLIRGISKLKANSLHPSFLLPMSGQRSDREYPNNTESLEFGTGFVADRSDRDRVWAKEAYFDSRLYLSRSAKRLIGIVVPLADRAHSGLRQFRAAA
jgi:hypothetical protein